VDAETGEALEIPWVGRGEDPADKGVSKALTDARKTFLIQQLNLQRGDDTEADEKHRPAPRAGRQSSPTGSVNMSDDAKGLTNAQLNAALVSPGYRPRRSRGARSRASRPTTWRRCARRSPASGRAS
jgi:hypothetical protein